ncbi:cytochrome c biogenesis CcdA family protein [Sanguibacter sp. Z1732]|uniref:cytochrome c biogenesis CcdA family protein n=1 Tax=Sanguibacter sp. Z1732 TaxID=3435412 RepID=UPI003D9C8EF4
MAARSAVLRRLVLVLVPLGVGAGAIGLLFSTYREPVIAIASLLLIVLGVVQVLGLGFDPARMLPGARGLQNQAQVRTGMLKTVLLGAVGGIAGFCAGPILGAVLTMAATQDSLVLSGAMLAIYGAGMVVPLLVLASVWGRLGAKGRSVLRGRTVSVFGRRLHTTSVITGVLMVVSVSRSGPPTDSWGPPPCCPPPPRPGCRNAAPCWPTPRWT